MEIKEDFFSRLLYGVVALGIIILTIVLVFLPKVMPLLFKNSTFYSLVNHSMLLGILYITGVMAWIILFVTIRLCKNIIKRDPFSESSVVSLKVISICSLGVFLCYLYMSIFMALTLGVFVITVAAFMICLVSVILYKLVEVALEIKRENDLTI